VGAEFTPQVSMLETRAETYNVHGTMMSFAFTGLYQYWYGNRTMALNVRLGGGLTVITGFYFDHDDGSSSDEVSSISPMINAGVSFERIFWRGFFAEGGLEYVQLFSSHNPMPGMLKAMVGVGWKF
jgi:hypothetical protein